MGLLSRGNSKKVMDKDWHVFFLLYLTSMLFAFIFMFDINDSGDFYIYYNAARALSAGENPYLIPGFYYLPHFFLFLPIILGGKYVFIIAQLTAWLYSLALVWKDRFIRYSIMVFGLFLTGGNFEFISILFVALYFNYPYNRANRKTSLAGMYIKPQIIVVDLILRWGWKCFYLMVIAINLVFVAEVVFGYHIVQYFPSLFLVVYSFSRPSVFLVVYYRKYKKL